jgi:hypothetical protein
MDLYAKVEAAVGVVGGWMFSVIRQLFLLSRVGA